MVNRPSTEPVRATLRAHSPHPSRSPRSTRAGVIAALAAATLVTGSCSAENKPAVADEETVEQVDVSSLDDTLGDFDLAGLDARESIEVLDTLPVAERPASSELIASVHADQLVYSNTSGEEATLPLPDGLFYLSVAPYIGETHSCYFHSLTTCVGELSETPVHVTFTDADTGEVLIDEDLTTYDNGFIGLWLPADVSGELTLTSDGLSATETVSTGPDDLTCLTTMRLS